MPDPVLVILLVLAAAIVAAVTLGPARHRSRSRRLGDPPDLVIQQRRLTFTNWWAGADTIYRGDLLRKPRGRRRRPLRSKPRGAPDRALERPGADPDSDR